MPRSKWPWCGELLDKKKIIIVSGLVWSDLRVAWIIPMYKGRRDYKNVGRIEIWRYCGVWELVRKSSDGSPGGVYWNGTTREAVWFREVQEFWQIFMLDNFVKKQKRRKMWFDWTSMVLEKAHDRAHLEALRLRMEIYEIRRGFGWHKKFLRMWILVFD